MVKNKRMGKCPRFINCQHLLDNWKSKRVPEKHLQLLYPGGAHLPPVSGLPDHLTYLLRNMYVGQEATVRTRHGKTFWFQIGKGVWQGCILSSCLFNLYAEYILQNAGLDESQAGMKIARKNNNKPRYANDTTQLAEIQEELKSLLIRVKEEWKSWHKTQHLKN